MCTYISIRKQYVPPKRRCLFTRFQSLVTRPSLSRRHIGNENSSISTFLGCKYCCVLLETNLCRSQRMWQHSPEAQHEEKTRGPTDWSRVILQQHLPFLHFTGKPQIMPQNYRQTLCGNCCIPHILPMHFHSMFKLTGRYYSRSLSKETRVFLEVATEILQTSKVF